MTETNWERLGRMLKERRYELNAPVRIKFARDKGFKNDRVLAALENAERTNFDDSTLTQAEIAYGWTIGSIAEVLAGGEPTLRATTEESLEGEGDRSGIAVMRSTLDRLVDEADDAQAEFERLASELAAAEAKVDATTRRVFHHLALEQNLQQERERREVVLGRPLTKIEWLAIDSVDRPTPHQVAEMTATHATIDPHEWTRYEMALVERFEAPYPQDVTQGSKYADLSVARALVARIPEPEGGIEHGESSAEKIAERLRRQQTALAAKRGKKEPTDESQ